MLDMITILNHYNHNPLNYLYQAIRTIHRSKC